MPAVRLQQVIAPPVPPGTLAADMPGVAVALHVQVPLPAEERQVQEVDDRAALPGFGGLHLNVILSLRPQSFALEGIEQAVLNRGAGEELVDLGGAGETPLGRGNEQQSPPLATEDGLWQLRERA